MKPELSKLAIGAAILPHLLSANTGFPEPPAVLFGRVVHMQAGTSHRVYQGELELTLVDDGDPSSQLTLSTELRRSGQNGDFSYYLEVPQHYLPNAVQRQSSLAVGETSANFRIQGITIEGIGAEPLHASQTFIDLQFTNRAQEHQLDLMVALPNIDSDNDGLPDWWEEQFRLNPLFAGDATDNTDGDAWDALTEFQNGGDPTQSDATATLLSDELWVVRNGNTGFFVQVRDSNDAPADIHFEFVGASAPTVIVNKGTTPLTAADTFTYADVLEGSISLGTNADVQVGDTIALNFLLSDSDATDAPVAVSICILDPTQMDLPQPELWLSTNTKAIDELITAGGPDLSPSKWTDLSGRDRAVYQPMANLQPTVASFNGAPGFLFAPSDASQFPYPHPPSFFYLDDTGLDLDEFSVFLRFAGPLGSLTHLDSPVTLLSLNDLKLTAAPFGASPVSRGFQLLRHGSIAHGTTHNAAEYIITASGNGADTRLTIDELPFEDSVPLGSRTFRSDAPGTYRRTLADIALPPVFSSIGAHVPVATGAPVESASAYIQEIILFDERLQPKSEARIDDYLNSINDDGMLWDLSDQTTPLNLNLSTLLPVRLWGGWGNDTFSCSNRADIIRGGPGDDLLTGNGASDRFQFFVGDGNDTITDFTASGVDADQLDLRAFFYNRSGTPDQYLNVRTVTTHVDGQIPVAKTLVELDYDGDGGIPDMIISLLNVSLDNADLPRLCGEQIINLGGPHYPVEFRIEALVSELTETEFPREIALSRQGNTANALAVFLSFAGSASLGEDFTTANIIEAGTLRRVDFAAGESAKTFDIQPVQDLFPESEEILIAVVPSPQVTELGSAQARLTLEDAPQVTIEALVDKAQRQGEVPGVIKVSRTGSNQKPLEVNLDFSGSAINGEDYVQVNPVVTIASGQSSAILELKPSVHAFDKNAPKVAFVSVKPDKTRFATFAPWSASVLFLDKYFSALHDYGTFEAGLAPEFRTGTDGDNDLIPLFMEYVIGADPTTADAIQIAQPNTYVKNGLFVIAIATQAALTDVRVQPQVFIDSNWTDISDGFDHQSYSVSGERIMHEFISQMPVSEWQTTRIYRLAFNQVIAESRESSASSLLGVSSPVVLAGGDGAWLPPIVGNGLQAPNRPSGQSSVVTFHANSTNQVSFDYSILAQSDATLTLN